MNRKLIFPAIVPVCLFFILLGMRVPDISRPARPAPRPRAIVESAPKGALDAGKRMPVTVAVLQTPILAAAPAVSHTSFHPADPRSASFVPTLPAARSPPRAA